jgi:hypothetical protein
MNTDGKIWRLQKLIVVRPALLAALSAGCEHRVVSAAPPQPSTVEVTSVVQKDVPIEGEWVGTLEGYVNAHRLFLVAESIARVATATVGGPT